VETLHFCFRGKGLDVIGILSLFECPIAVPKVVPKVTGGYISFLFPRLVPNIGIKDVAWIYVRHVPYSSLVERVRELTHV